MRNNQFQSCLSDNHLAKIVMKQATYLNRRMDINYTAIVTIILYQTLYYIKKCKLALQTDGII